MRVLNRLDISGSFGLGSTSQDQFVIGSPDLENNDISTDNLKIWANADFKNNVTLGSNNSDIIAISGTLINQGGASLTGSFSGSGENLTNIPNSGLQNYQINLNGSNLALGATGSVGTLREITGGSNITIGLVNATTRSVSLNDNINLTSVSASFSGSGTLINNLTASNISNFNTDVGGVFLAGTNVTINQVGNQYAISASAAGPGGTIYTEGNITGSGEISNKIRTKDDVTFTTVTASYYTGSSANLDYVYFTDQASDPTQVNGALWHRVDSDYNELRLWTEVPGVHIKLGQQVVVRVHNGTGSPITKGSVVHLTGAVSPAVPRIAKADWTNDYLSANTLGVLNSTLNNGDEGYVVISGLIEGVDTNAFAEGDVLYLSGSGGISNVKAVAPNHLVIVGQVIRVGNSSVGSIFVKIQNGYEIGELHDVIDSSPQNYDLLVRDTDGLWKNTKNLSGSYNFNNTQSINVNSTTPALKINQLGTGPVFFAEDQTSPDGTGFLIDKQGGVGILVNSASIIAPSFALYVNGMTYSDQFRAGQYVTASSFTGSSYTASIGYYGRLFGTASYALDSDKLDGYDSSDFPRLSANNTFTGVNTLGAFTGSSAFISGDVRINGTASVAVLNTINQTSLNVGDKYIIILSGATDHPSLDGSGLLWGSGALGDPTQGPLGEMAYVRYYATNDQLEIFPGLKVSGSLTASAPSSFTQITASTGFSGNGSQLTNIPATAVDLSSYAKSLDVSSSFGLKTDLTASYARLATANIFSANQTVTGSLYVSSVISGSQISSSNGFYTSGSSNTSIFDVSSSNSALRVTQRGTGEAFRVEDSINPDTTPFVILGDGKVGINVQTPISPLNISGTLGAALSTATVLLTGTLQIPVGAINHGELNTIGSSVTKRAFVSGYRCLADSDGAFAVGSDTRAMAAPSFAQGFRTEAAAVGTHAEGESTRAVGMFSHTEGLMTTSSVSYQHVEGQYNSSSNAMLVVGNGTSNAVRSNILEVFTNIVAISGSLGVTSNLTASNITASNITASGIVSASYLYGDATNLTNVPPASIYIAGNLTGSGILANPYGTNVDSTYLTLTASTGFSGGSFSGTQVTASTGFSGGTFSGTTVSASIGLTGSNLHVVTQAEFDGGVKIAYSAKINNYTLTASSDYVISFSGSALTGTLPNAANNLGTVLVIKNLHTSSVFVTSSTARIDGSTTGVFINGQYTSYTFLSDNTNWLII